MTAARAVYGHMRVQTTYIFYYLGRYRVISAQSASSARAGMAKYTQYNTLLDFYYSCITQTTINLIVYTYMECQCEFGKKCCNRGRI